MDLRTIHIGIWGLGLMGGSLAKALRTRSDLLAERGLRLGSLAVFERDPAAVEQALSEAVADCGKILSQEDEVNFRDPELRRELERLDVLYLALPMHLIASYAQQIARYSPCLMTDVGSVKQPVLEATRELRFIGGHPMAGSERQGYACGQAHLFENAVWVFCESGAEVKDGDRELLRSLAEALGAQPLELTARAHDQAVAVISHLPHVTAASLVRRLASGEEPALRRLAAGGFKDLTRIASGDPALWAGICAANREALLPALEDLILDLTRFRAELLRKGAAAESAPCVEAPLRQSESAELKAFFASAKNARDSLPEGLGGALQAPALLLVDVLDKPGELAHITRVLGEAGINIRNIGIQDARQYEGGILRLYLADGGERTRAAQILEGDGYACN